MRLDAEPAAPHFLIDNRLAAAMPLAAQIARLVDSTAEPHASGR